MREIPYRPYLSVYGVPERTELGSTEVHTELRSSSWQYDLLKISADGTGGPSMKTIRDAHALSFPLPLAFSNYILPYVLRTNTSQAEMWNLGRCYEWRHGILRQGE